MQTSCYVGAGAEVAHRCCRPLPQFGSALHGGETQIGGNKACTFLASRTFSFGPDMHEGERTQSSSIAPSQIGADFDALDRAQSSESLEGARSTHAARGCCSDSPVKTFTFGPSEAPSLGSDRVAATASVSSSSANVLLGRATISGVVPADRSAMKACHAHEEALEAGRKAVTVLQRASNRSPVTREELMEQGLSLAVADARIVHDHEREVLDQNFACWILGFMVIVCVSVPSMLGLLLWLVIAYHNNMNTACSVPLQTYALVVFAVVSTQALRSCLLRLLCRWSLDADNPGPVPARVKLYHLAVTAFAFVWHCIGIYWVFSDSNIDATKPACSKAVPQLYNAARAYSLCSVIFTAFFIVNIIGAHTILRFAYQNGFIRAPNAAPFGALDRNARVVDKESFDEGHTSCAVCMEDYKSSEKDVIQLHACGHVFHRQCLSGWLNVNRTCPLCREDIGS